ncbi:MAG: signal peptidase I [Spirochaetes bacterium]|nr:signal peptidase I [Spirochaetota bacterium]MBN2771161.1 signal peptidase I [Spirochaetota bacterium]
MYKDPDSLNGSIFSKIVFLTTGLCIGFLITVIFFGAYRVSDKNMSPVLEPGDYIFINRYKSASVGDVVLVKSPVQEDRFYLSRVVAVGESSVRIEKKVLYVNDAPSDIKFYSKDSRVLPGEKTERDNMSHKPVSKDTVFIIGDNWDYSYDSRYFGPISTENIKGVVFLKI